MEGTLALKSQDDGLAELIDNYRIALGSRKKRMPVPEQIGNIHFDLPDQIGEEFEKALRVIMIRSTTDAWLEMLGRYEKLDEEPKKGTKEHVWVYNQRHLAKNNLLRADRLKILKDRNFIFSVNDHTGICFSKNINIGMMTNIGGLRIDHLYNWGQAQRKSHRNGTLPKHRFDILDSYEGWHWIRMNGTGMKCIKS